MASFNMNEFNRKLREAQRKAQQELNRQIDRINQANKQAIDDYNRKAKAHNKKVIDDYNAQVRDHNRKADACVFRDKPATYSSVIRPGIPKLSGH